jgi:hypothetical protein
MWEELDKRVLTVCKMALGDSMHVEDLKQEVLIMLLEFDNLENEWEDNKDYVMGLVFKLVYRNVKLRGQKFKIKILDYDYYNVPIGNVNPSLLIDRNDKNLEVEDFTKGLSFLDRKWVETFCELGSSCNLMSKYTEIDRITIKSNMDKIFKKVIENNFSE